MNADQMAVRILLAGGPKMQQRLAALGNLVDQAIGGGRCPECGAHGPHPDNGDAADLMFCCEACGEHFQVNA